MNRIGLRGRTKIITRHWSRLMLAGLAACGSDYPTPANTPPVQSVTVSPTPAALIVGATHQFTATVRTAAGAIVTDRTITWATSDTTKARVNGSGLVTPVANGSVQIVATAERVQGVATATVVTLPVASIAMTPSTANVQVGRTQQLTARLLSNTGAELPGQRTITWASSNTANATVDARGVVTAVRTGTATITATCEGQSASAQITVVP